MTDIFISYSRNDREKVRLIANRLTDAGYNVWWDTEIPPGSSFAEVIDEKLNAADCVIVAWSPSAITSNWVQEEADDGLMRKRLIPVMIEPTDLPRGFKRVQTADLTQWRGEQSHPQWQMVLEQVSNLIAAGRAGVAQGARAPRKEPPAPTARAAKASAPPAATSPTATTPKALRGAGFMGPATGLLALAALGGGAYFAYSSGLLDQIASPTATAGARKPATADIVAGAIIKDCDQCPEMVVAPAGELLMGAPTTERSHDKSETPQTPVRLARPFAIGKYEVTFDQWRACVDAGGCGGYRPKDHGWGAGARPVINVSYEDALSYAEWLTTVSGKVYRLPTEAEWEYAARAGTATPFAFGEAISTRLANFDGAYPYGNAAAERSAGKTLPVGSFSANAFGLHDMHGNVWEWVSDCWANTHASAPQDGRAVSVGACSKRVRKGGAWNAGGWRARSAHRIAAAATSKDFDAGFRVVLDLDAEVKNAGR